MLPIRSLLRSNRMMRHSPHKSAQWLPFLQASLRHGIMSRFARTHCLRTKKPVPAVLLGQVRYSSCGATRLGMIHTHFVHTRHVLSSYAGFYLRSSETPSPILCHAFPVALRSPFNPGSLPQSHRLRLSLKDLSEPTHSSSTV